MATACPHCGVPAGPASKAFDAGGRLMRCGRCGTAWFARVHADDHFGGEGHALTIRRPSRPGFERVIDHVGPSFERAAAPRQNKPAGQPLSARPAIGANPSHADRFRLPGGRLFSVWASLTAGAALVAIVTALSLYWSSFDARNEQFAGLEIRLLRGAIEPAREGRALAVEGEIANRTDGVLGVPAVRISLRSDGQEVYSWMVEPTTTRLAAGRAVLFRSVLAAPPAGVDEVAFRLAERRDTVVGMR